MITSKHLFIGIVLLGISIFCTAQEVKIEFSYDKPTKRGKRQTVAPNGS